MSILSLYLIGILPAALIVAAYILLRRFTKANDIF